MAETERSRDLGHPNLSLRKAMSDYPTLLRRSVHNRVLGGVCGGLAEYFGLDPVAVRVGYVLLSTALRRLPGDLGVYRAVAADPRTRVLLSQSRAEV